MLLVVHLRDNEDLSCESFVLVQNYLLECLVLLDFSKRRCLLEFKLLFKRTVLLLEELSHSIFFRDSFLEMLSRAVGHLVNNGVQLLSLVSSVLVKTLRQLHRQLVVAQRSLMSSSALRLAMSRRLA